MKRSLTFVATFLLVSAVASAQTAVRIGNQTIQNPGLRFYARIACKLDYNYLQDPRRFKGFAHSELDSVVEFHWDDKTCAVTQIGDTIRLIGEGKRLDMIIDENPLRLISFTMSWDSGMWGGDQNQRWHWYFHASNISLVESPGRLKANYPSLAEWNASIDSIDFSYVELQNGFGHELGAWAESLDSLAAPIDIQFGETTMLDVRHQNVWTNESLRVHQSGKNISLSFSMSTHERTLEIRDIMGRLVYTIPVAPNGIEARIPRNLLRSSAYSARLGSDQTKFILVR